MNIDIVCFWTRVTVLNASLGLKENFLIPTIYLPCFADVASG